MRGKGSSVLLIVVGALALVAGLVAQFVVIPGMLQFPEDVDSERSYEGEMAVMLNGAALAAGDLENVFVRDLPVTIERRVQALEVDTGKALVLDSAVLSGPAGPLNQAEDTYSIDRKSMLAIPNFTDNPDVIDSEGLVIGFPIGTEARDYLGFNGDTLTTNTIAFVREEERAGLSTYLFEGGSGPDQITDPDLLATFPAELPKDALAQMVPALGDC